MDQLLKAGALKRKNEINTVEVVCIVKLSRLGGVVVSVVAGSNTAKAMDF
jgi:starvation-inducible outer membrane lipoprotein